MDKVFHPISGEEGYFCSNQEKVLIDAILVDYTMKNQLDVVQESSATGRGVVDE